MRKAAAQRSEKTPAKVSHQAGAPRPAAAEVTAAAPGNAWSTFALGGAQTAGPGAQAALQRVLAEPGWPLAPALRRPLAKAFRSPFGGVRVHSSGLAAEAAKAWQARAFTFGAHLVFGAGEFDPATRAGRRLLAHELAHVVQQDAGAGLALQAGGTPVEASQPGDAFEAQAERAAEAQVAGHPLPPLGRVDAPSLQQRPTLWREPPTTPVTSSVDPLLQPADARATASLSGLTLAPAEGALIDPAVPHADQVWAVLLHRLAPAHYRPEWINGVQAHLLASGGYQLELVPLTGPGPHPLPTLRVLADVALRTIDYLESEIGSAEARSAWLNLQPSQVELLELGREIDQTIADTRDPEVGPALAVSDFPGWYDPEVFRADAQSFGRLLRAQMAERRSFAAAAAGPVSASRTALTAAQNALFEAMKPAARAVEAMRQESLLQADPDLRVLWRCPATGDPSPATAGAPPALSSITAMLGFVRTQPGLLSDVLAGGGGDPPPTVTLFQRFTRFAARFSPSGTGDANLADQPADRNADPLPAQVAAYPQLEPPNYDAALGTDHLFTIDVSFSDVWEHLANHFGGYGYRWELIEVPDQDLERIEETAATAPGSGTEPDWGDVWGARMARQGRYAIADLSRGLDSDSPAARIAMLTGGLGPPFLGAGSALAANALLRSLGEVISTFFEMLTEPREERHIVFPHAGLWVVRATCSPVLNDDSEFRRMPSVAWVPVYARSAQTMGTLRLEQAVGARLQQEMQLTAILLQLETQNECGPEWDELVRTRDAFALQLYGSGGDLLEQQRRALQARLAEPELPDATAAVLRRQIEALTQQIELRADRAGDLLGAQRLELVFVTDTGTVIRPLIEGVPHEGTGGASWYLSDITTPNSADVTGRGSSRDAALMAGLMELFERHTGYGRGELQVFVPDRDNPGHGHIEHRRIEADATALAMESIERITTVVTIAAMVAAPFTGGASLAILLPVGVIGAVPSAYRLADRAENGTLRPDVQTLMDVVNILGAGLGAVGEGAGALRMVRLQRFVAITGLGSDGLTLMVSSYEMLRQLDELPADMPRGARRAAVMRIVAAEMQAIGMVAAGRLMGHADSLEGASRPVDESSGPHAIAEPGAHASVSGGAVDAAPPRRAASPEMEAHLPADLQGRVRVESDSSLAGGSAEVRYDLDAFGTIREVYIAHGEGASPTAMGAHAVTARRLVELSSFGARLRTFYNRLRLALGGTAPPRPGTEAFNAQFEVPKLREWLAQRQQAVREGRIDADQFAAERALYDDQIAYYEHLIEVFERTGDAGGEGSAVAARSRLQWTRERLRQRFSVDGSTLPEARPGGWGGEHEAAWQGFPQAEPNYHWRLLQPGNELSYAKSPGAPEGTPRRAFDAANGEFVTVPEGISPTGITAIREGLPPPPPDHHYRYYEATESWELALNDGAADRGVTPQALVESPTAPGTYGFEPRQEGAGTLIRRRPYRGDLELGGTRPSDLLASAETRARYEELLNRRDAALRARETAREALPPEPDAANAEAHRAWEESPAVREYLRLRNQVGTASRDIGSFAADAHVRRQFEGAVRIHPAEGVALDAAGSSSGDFDMVYRLPDGRMVVVEAKGGSSPLGSRRVSGERGVSAQQGTREYYLEIVDSMARRGGSYAEASTHLQAVLPADVIYLHIETPITTSGSGTLSSEVGALRVHAFDLGAPGLRPESVSTAP